MGKILAIRSNIIDVQEDDGVYRHTIARTAEITLNGKKVKIADLDNGDTVTVRGHTAEGSKTVIAIRDTKAQAHIGPRKISDAIPGEEGPEEFRSPVDALGEVQQGGDS